VGLAAYSIYSLVFGIPFINQIPDVHDNGKKCRINRNKTYSVKVISKIKLKAK
jgi:hypothetical protein